MKDLLNEINEKFRFETPKTGSWHYYQFSKDKQDDKEDGEEEVTDDPGSVGESNVTSNIDGGEGPPRTPHAFDSKKSKHKEKRKSNIKATGKDYTLIGDLYEEFNSTIEDIDFVVSEISYRSYKKDERTGRQKVNQTLIDVYQKLKEVENLLDVNVKLKVEDGLHNEMWPKASPKRMQRIDKKLETIKRKLKKMY